MDKLINGVLSVPVATLFIVTGIVFLFIAVVGKISGKIEPSKKSRITSGILGFIFILGGLAMHLRQEEDWLPKVTDKLKVDHVASISEIKPSKELIPSEEQNINDTYDHSSMRTYFSNEKEPNDSFLTATPIEINTSVHGDIMPAKDLDHYILNIFSEQPKTMKIQFKNLSMNLAPEVKLYNSEKSEIHHEYRTTRGADINFSYTVKQDETYYIRIFSYNLSKNNGGEYDIIVGF